MAQRRPTFILISIAHERQIAEILSILRQFRIPVDVVERGTAVREPRTIVLRISPDRVAETVLALELLGYQGVRAFEFEESGRTDIKATPWSGREALARNGHGEEREKRSQMGSRG